MPALLTVETDAVRVTWRRRRPPAAPPAADGAAPVVEAAPGVPAAAHGTAVLAEQTDYVVLVRARPGGAVTVRHRDPVIVGGLDALGDVVHGVVNFGAQVGRSRFEVWLDGCFHVAFEVEVRPTKLDYRTDYAALRADVEAVGRDLVVAYLRSTYTPARAEAPGPPGAAGWARLLGRVAADLERALAHVARHPLPDVAPALGRTRPDAVRRPDAALRRALRTAGGAESGALPNRHARPTLDQPEHRWLAARLDRARRALRALRVREARRTGPRAAPIRAELAALAGRLDALRALPPLAAAGAEPPPEPSVRLLAAAGYREAYAALLALTRGLRLGGGPVGLGMQDLHRLYEMWCYLTLVRLVAALGGSDLPASRLVRAAGDGLRYRLRAGRRHAVVLPLPDGGRARLVYNPRFGGPHLLVPQRPDIVLDVHRADGSRARYVLDAKYRLDDTPGYVRRYGVPGPPTDALGVLHRYRDALVDRAGRRTVVQAVALYPWREAAPGAFAGSRHGQAVARLGVGALPLLPGATAPLEMWLHGVLGGRTAGSAG